MWQRQNKDACEREMNREREGLSDIWSGHIQVWSQCKSFSYLLRVAHEEFNLHLWLGLLETEIGINMGNNRGAETHWRYIEEPLWTHNFPLLFHHSRFHLLVSKSARESFLPCNAFGWVMCERAPVCLLGGHTSRSSCCRSQTTPVSLLTEKYLTASSPETPYMRGSPSGSSAFSCATEEPARQRDKGQGSYRVKGQTRYFICYETSYSHI